MRNWKSNCQTCNKTIPYGNDCKDCKAEKRRIAKTEKRKKKEQDAIKVCPQCKNEFKSYDKIKFLCSVQCSGLWNRKKRITVKCCVCDKSIQRTKSQCSKREKFCCSLECQNKYWCESGHKTTEESIAKKQQRVKKSWYIKRTRERRKQSIEYQWWKGCVKNSLSPTIEKSEWEKKCDVVAVGIKKRPPSKSNSRKTKEVKKWEKVIVKSIQRLDQKIKRSSWNGWERCCNSVMRNIRSRSRI